MPPSLLCHNLLVCKSHHGMRDRTSGRRGRHRPWALSPAIQASVSQPPGLSEPGGDDLICRMALVAVRVLVATNPSSANETAIIHHHIRRPPEV
jgi:hypothetical protein